MQEKILTKNFIFAFLSLFCSAMVMYMLLGTITEYAEGMGTGVMLAGLVSGIYVFGGLCSRLCAGAGMGALSYRPSFENRESEFVADEDTHGICRRTS